MIHVVAERIDDLTPLLRRLSEEHGTHVESLSRCDEVKRPDPGSRSQKRRDAERNQLALTADISAKEVMPKGRNFH